MVVPSRVQSTRIRSPPWPLELMQQGSALLRVALLRLLWGITIVTIVYTC